MVNNTLTKIALFFFGLSILTLVLNYHTYVNADDGNEKLTVSREMALRAIQEASAEGADISKLADQFNVAVDLVQHGQISDFDLCRSHDDCVDRASTIFMSVATDAATLRDNARNASAKEMILSEVYVLIGAFATSFLALFCYGHWKSTRLVTFLNSEIREVE